MTTTARSVVERAHIALQDPRGIRWPATDLVTYLNDGQRALAVVRPDEFAVTGSFATARGARQVLPPEAALFIGVTRNTSGSKSAIGIVDMVELDAIEPGWQGMAETTEFEHFMFSQREPRVFHLYPPSKAAGGSVELVTSNYPEDIPAPGGATADTVTGNLSASDQWANALLSYVLFRAYAKDSESASNAVLSGGYLAAFNAETGAQLQSATAVASTNQ